MFTGSTAAELLGLGPLQQPVRRPASGGKAGGVFHQLQGLGRSPEPRAALRDRSLGRSGVRADQAKETSSELQLVRRCSFLDRSARRGGPFSRRRARGGGRGCGFLGSSLFPFPICSRRRSHAKGRGEEEVSSPYSFAPLRLGVRRSFVHKHEQGFTLADRVAHFQHKSGGIFWRDSGRLWGMWPLLGGVAAIWWGDWSLKVTSPGGGRNRSATNKKSPRANLGRPEGRMLNVLQGLLNSRLLTGRLIDGRAR